MAKSAEPQQLQDSTMQYQLAMFWAFSDQQSIGLSVKSISTVAPINISSSINNQGFCKQLSSYTLITIYQHQGLRRTESISGYNFNFVSAFEEKSPAQRKCPRLNEVNPMRSAIVWIEYSSWNSCELIVKV